MTHIVNHFDGHFAYLKTLDFYFKVCTERESERERERERERQRQRQRQRERETDRETERDRDREKHRERECCSVLFSPCWGAVIYASYSLQTPDDYINMIKRMLFENYTGN